MADNNTAHAQKIAAIKAARDRAFDQFIARPEVKLIISLIPPNDAAPEALQGLLQATYSAGFERGAYEFLHDIAGAIFSGKTPRD